MFQWPPLDVSAGGRGVGPQVHKFEQVSSDNHLMFAGGNEPETEAYRSFSDEDRNWK